MGRSMSNLPGRADSYNPGHDSFVSVSGGDKRRQPQRASAPGTINVRAVMVRRYGIDITREELLKLKKTMAVSENILNFFVRYLEEKHSYVPIEKQRRNAMRFFFYTTDMYRKLTNGDPFNHVINYDSVKEITKRYVGRYNTVVEQFDKILIPIQYYGVNTILVVVDCSKKAYVLLDTSNKPEKDAYKNPFLSNVSKYLERDYNDKAHIHLNNMEWDYGYEMVPKHSDATLSGVYVAKFLHTIVSEGRASFLVNEEELVDFTRKLYDLCMKVGITNDTPGELSSFDNYPL
jgi:Ulp1 family protease